MLQRIFQMQNEVMMTVSGTESVRMEIRLDSPVEPGDRCVICVNSVFNGCMAHMDDCCDPKIRCLKCVFDEVCAPEEIERHHNPWSSGSVAHPVERQVTGCCRTCLLSC